MTPHRIQLRGPWNFQPLAFASTDEVLGPVLSQRELPPAGTVKMPVSWQEMLGTFRGSVRFLRAFHRPTNLEPEERVQIVFVGVGGTGTVTVNGALLGTLRETLEPQPFDITALLKGDELVEVDLEFTDAHISSASGGLYGPVFIEIGRSA